MEYPEFLHPANAEELANIAQETGAEVLRGALHYPSESGGWQLGEVDLSERLEKYHDREMVLIIASEEMTQQFEEIRRRLDHLRANLDVPLAPHHENTEDTIESDNGGGEETGSEERLSWFKTLLFPVKVLLFLVAFVTVEIATNVLASMWKVETQFEYWQAAAALILGIGVLTFFGRSVISEVLKKDSVGGTE